MALPVVPPLAPMLARLARELPPDGFLYEPKWDGFRCLVFRDRDEIDLRSRHGRPFARYFPELVEALLALPAERFVLDGEIVVVTPEGFDFAALMSRLHPSASRVE
ncbi:MAG: ATP-dependent DNA ligase, partial [Actinomycetota bacterium]|nr:ATP-dependent DNA ligase [Actinomycetota bacterium]